MKKWKIKYQKGNDILIKEIEAETKTKAQMIFYLENTYCNIITIEEATNETVTQ